MDRGRTLPGRSGPCQTLRPSTLQLQRGEELSDRLGPVHAVQHAAPGAPAFPFGLVQQSVG
jgi:hypothetical protein